MSSRAADRRRPRARRASPCLDRARGLRSRAPWPAGTRRWPPRRRPRHRDTKSPRFDRLPRLTLPKNDTHRALVFMFASAMMFGAMAVSAEIAASRLSGPEGARVRMAVGLVPVLLVPRWLHSAASIQRWDLILIRGVFRGGAGVVFFLSIQHVSVGVATLLNYTSPIWSGLMSMLFLRERFGARVLIPLPIAFGGILLVVHAHAA